MVGDGQANIDLFIIKRKIQFNLKESMNETERKEVEINWRKSQELEKQEEKISDNSLRGCNCVGISKTSSISFNWDRIQLLLTGVY